MNETIRARISRQKRYVFGVMWSGIPLFVIAAALGQKYPWTILLAVLCFAMCFGAMFYAYFGLRCPRCRQPMGSIVINYGTPFAVSKKMNFCPWCGVHLDTEIEGKQKDGQPG